MGQSGKLQTRPEASLKGLWGPMALCCSAGGTGNGTTRFLGSPVGLGARSAGGAWQIPLPILGGMQGLLPHGDRPAMALLLSLPGKEHQE